MTDEDTISRSGRIDRRKFIAGVGTGVALGLAGCTGDSGQSGQQGNGNGNSGGNQNQQGGSGNTQQTANPSKRVKGGKPILGMYSPPDNLNPLKTGSAYSWTILENIYTFGTYPDVNTYKPGPWGFQDWTLNEQNIGTGKPTIVGNLRDDLTFSDGKKVTAEDVKFTVEYIQEQEPAGTISASQVESVEEVKIDKKSGTRVEYYLSKPDSAWLTGVVGQIILPKHIWKDVANSQKYSPRKNGGPVGSGPMTLDDYSWENWFELSMRSDDAIPWNELDYTEWLVPEGPFVDGLRVEVFGTQNAMIQSLLDGKIDQSYGTVPVEDAVTAQQQSSLEVIQSADDGWHHQSFNTRRVPLDDPAFRQMIVKALNQTWVIEKLYRGIGAEYGDYATPKAYKDWRPPVPAKSDGEYEGIRIPDLEFPSQKNTYSLSQSDVDALRSFLLDHPNAKHDYSLGPAVSNEVQSPDGKSIYVNGEPLVEAHTNNDGQSMGKPLEMSYNPPSQDPKSAQIASSWGKALNTVGVPTVSNVQAFNSQLAKVYANEDFDMFEMGWTGIVWNNDHYKQFYSSEGADGPNEQIKVQTFNPMGYTAADDLIFKQASMMDPKERKPIVKKALAKIYQDSPTQITHYANVLQPVTTRFGGRVEAVGGVTHKQTWLNIWKKQQ